MACRRSGVQPPSAPQFTPIKKLDNKTTVQDLKDRVRRFCGDRDWDRYHNAKDLAIGIITEASELLVQFRFKSEKEVELLFKAPKTRAAICDEVVDILHTVSSGSRAVSQSSRAFPAL